MFTPILKRQLEAFDISGFEISGHVDLRCSPFEEDFSTIGSFTVRFSMYGCSQSLDTVTGMSTDLASVPREVWSIIPPHRKIKRPAVFHDYLYQYRPAVTVPADGVRSIGRNEADALLYHACKSEGMSDENCFLVYQAVRIGGRSVWHAHDAEFHK